MDHTFMVSDAAVQEHGDQINQPTPADPLGFDIPYNVVAKQTVVDPEALDRPGLCDHAVGNNPDLALSAFPHHKAPGALRNIRRI